MTADLTPRQIWADRRTECEGKLWLVNRELANMGRRDLRDTEHGRDLVAWAVHYGVGPIDTACQIIDDDCDATRAA